MKPCPPSEIVCVLRPKGVRDIFHMYGAVLEEFGVRIHFTLFLMDVMRFFNVAPTQIRPNSWAFIRGFEILCEALDMVLSAGAFFHFFGTKGVDKGSWVSMSAHAGKSLFPSYASNFKKNWRVSFMKVCAVEDSGISVASVDGELRFPLSWTSSPQSICGYDYNKMTPYERDVVSFLDRMKLTDIRTLLNKETDSKDLKLYLREYLSFTFSVCLNFLILLLTTAFLFFLILFCSSNDAAHSKGKEEVSCCPEKKECLGVACRQRPLLVYY